MAGGKTGEKVLTEFGATVLALMAERGVRTQVQLVERLERVGFEVTQPGLAGWLYGRYNVSRAFPAAFAEALSLTEPQKTRLAIAYTYGQTTPLAA